METADRVEMYKMIAQILLTRQYHLEETGPVAAALNYLKQEIENHVSSQTDQDSGPQG